LPPLSLPLDIHNMQFTTAFVLAALPFLVSGAAVESPVNEHKLTVGLTKRSRLTHQSGAVDIAAVKTHVSRTSAKIQRGFAAFQRNTGVPHPLAAPQIETSKRATGSNKLTDDHEELWYGTISVGTPAIAFTGEPRLSCPVLS
jgi:cathepsin D